jgi:hypothetical protein
MTKMTNEQKAHEISLRLMADGLREKNGYSQRKAIEKALVEMANWKDEYYKLELDAKDEDVIQTDIDWKAVYDAEVVRHAELKAELDALKAEHANAQQQLAEYRQALAELSNTNSKLVKDITALSVSRCTENENTHNTKK